MEVLRRFRACERKLCTLKFRVKLGRVVGVVEVLYMFFTSTKVTFFLVVRAYYKLLLTLKVQEPLGAAKNVLPQSFLFIHCQRTHTF